MKYGLQRTTEPAAEPVSVAEAKAHLRVTSQDDDVLIAELIRAARQWFEEQTYRALVSQTWDLTLDRFPAGRDPIRVPRAPLIGVTSLVYTDAAGTSQTWAASEYLVSATRSPGVIRPASGRTWPGVDDRPDAVRVRFVAGYGTPADVPSPIKSAIKLMVGQAYEFREELTERPTQALPLGAQRIMAMYDVGDELLEYGC